MKKRIRIILVFIFLLLLIEPLPCKGDVFERATETGQKKMVIIGDSYALGYTPDDSVNPGTESWPILVLDDCGTSDSIIMVKNGAGFVKSNQGENFTNLIEKAYEITEDSLSVEEIIVCGGYNDMYYSSDTIYYAAQFFANTAKKLFPNANISIGMISWHESNSAIESDIIHNVLPAYRKAAELNGLCYITGCEYLFQNNKDMFSQDHFHPNAEGQKLLADYLSRYLQGEPFFTGLKKIDGRWIWFENGAKAEDFTGLKRNENGWWYIRDGEVDFSYNGFASNEYGWWYVENGTITFQKNDIIKGFANAVQGEESKEAWWNIAGSKVVNLKTVAHNSNGWWYINNGQVDFTYSGIQRNDNGWWYIKDGKVDFSYNGFAKNEYGWWYAENGKVTFEKNDIIKGFANIDPELEGEEAWWFIAGSRVTRAETVAKNTYGWWYVNQGRVDFTYQGIQPNENGQWLIKNGQVDFRYNGFVKNENEWWLIRAGKVYNEKEDIVYGQANILPEAEAETAWWFVRDGKVTDTTTVAANVNGYWYVKNGKVDFTFNGFEFIDNCIWSIRNGKAVLIVRY